MATSSTNWKPVSRRTTVLPDGSILKRIHTERYVHDYRLTTPNKKVRDISLNVPLPDESIQWDHRRLNRHLFTRPIHKALLAEVGVKIPYVVRRYGTPADFHSIGHGVVKNVALAFKKLYPKMKGIYGYRLHKPSVSKVNQYSHSVTPITLLKFKNIKSRS